MTDIGNDEIWVWKWVWEGGRDDGYNGASLIGLEGMDGVYEYGNVGLNGERW